jgi:hypothetical protein
MAQVDADRHKATAAASGAAADGHALAVVSAPTDYRATSLCDARALES